MKTGMNGMNAVADDDDVISLGMVGGVVQLRSSFPSSLKTLYSHWLAVRPVPVFQYSRRKKKRGPQSWESPTPYAPSYPHSPWSWILPKMVKNQSGLPMPDMMRWGLSPAEYPAPILAGKSLPHL